MSVNLSELFPPSGGSGGGECKPPVFIDSDPPDDVVAGELWYDSDNDTLNLFDGTDWIVIGVGSKTVFKLPASLRSGNVELPVSDDGDHLPVSLRSGDSQVPLNSSGDALPVETRAGNTELPLAS
jgi:hypothetical protein